MLDGLIIDNFAGGGGASTGIEMALGRSPDIAINHSADARARMAAVTVEISGEPYVIADIGMRMLSPRELFRAQGFPDSYVIDPVFEGKRLTKTAQIRMCGNSVCPDMAAALVRANVFFAMAESEAA